MGNRRRAAAPGPAPVRTAPALPSACPGRETHSRGCCSPRRDPARAITPAGRAGRLRRAFRGAGGGRPRRTSAGQTLPPPAAQFEGLEPGGLGPAWRGVAFYSSGSLVLCHRVVISRFRIFSRGAVHSALGPTPARGSLQAEIHRREAIPKIGPQEASGTAGSGLSRSALTSFGQLGAGAAASCQCCIKMRRSA